MGIRSSKRQGPPASGAETAATEQKAAEEPAAMPAAPVIPQNQEAVEAEKPAAVASEPAEKPVTEIKAEPEPEAPAAPAPLKDNAPEPVAEETPAPPEPVSAVEPPAPEPVAEPQPVAEPEPVPEPNPEPEPMEAAPEPTSEPVPPPAEALEQEIAQLNQEVSLPEPDLSSAPLVDLGVPELTSLAIDTAPSPANPDESSDVPGVGECQDGVEAAVNSMSVPEESVETVESLEKLVEPEGVGAENLEQLVCDVNSEESVSGLLKHLDLTGNDLVSDLIPNAVKIPDDIPITDMSASTELM